MRYTVIFLMVGILGISSCCKKECCVVIPQTIDSNQIADSLIVPAHTYGDSSATYTVASSTVSEGPSSFYISFHEKHPISEPPSISFTFKRRPVGAASYKVVPNIDFDAADEVTIRFNHAGPRDFRWSINLPENDIMVYVTANGKLHLVSRSVKLMDIHTGGTAAIFFNLTEF